MRKLILGAGFLAAAMTLTPAFARYVPRVAYYPQPAPAQNSIYISGDVGYGVLATPDVNLLDPDGYWIYQASHSNSTISAGGDIGYRRAVSRSFLVGTEFGYDYNGRAKYDEDWFLPDFWGSDYTSYKVISQDLHLLLTGTIMMPHGFNVFGKAGVARVDQTLRITNQMPYVMPYVMTENRLVQYKPMAAAGIGYQFGVINIYGQYSHIFGTNASNFSDFIDPETGNFTQVVSVDTFKLGMALNIRV
ncbi:MAG: hypothetical protein JSR33_12865 [Proteobacteria bacterium]|nr:hypothetical protein [Pseudomonadota bacterium]